MWFSLSLDIIFGTEAAKSSPIENLEAEEMGGKKDIHTYRERSEFTEGLNTKHVCG